MSRNNDLEEKIVQARTRLPLPRLMELEGLGVQVKKNKNVRCPFHPDKRPSFSVFEENGRWRWKCHAGCGGGDEIDFLCKLRGISKREAVSLYLEMAGFPAGSLECSEPAKCSGPSVSPELSECSEYAVSSVSSNGQALDSELRALAASCQCVAPRTSDKKRFQLCRGFVAIQEREGRKLTNAELTLAIQEWHRLSQSVLGPQETLEHHLLRGLAELRKVTTALGREVISQAIDVVLKLPVSDLPVIPGIPTELKSPRRVAALHRELARRSTKKDKAYFLGCRDAARAHPGLSKT